MGVGLSADTHYARRSGIPDGTAGTLSDGAFTNFFVGVWLRRPTAGNSYALTSDGSIIHGQAGAREIRLGFNNTFGDGSSTAPSLHATFNSDGSLLYVFPTKPALDEWAYYFLMDSAALGMVAGYRTLSDPTLIYTTAVNTNAGSQYVNTLTFGNDALGSATVFGHYAYARARYGSGITLTDVATFAASYAPAVGDWGYWPLADNTDVGDDSGNSRDLTFSAGLSTEGDPAAAAVVDVGAFTFPNRGRRPRSFAPGLAR